MDSGGCVTKRKVISIEERLGSDNLSGRRRFSPRFVTKVTSTASNGTSGKITSPDSDSTVIKSAGWRRCGRLLRRDDSVKASNITDITTPVYDIATAKIVDLEKLSERSESKQGLQIYATSPVSNVTDITSPASNATEVASPASNGRGSEDSFEWNKRFSPRLKNIPLVQRPFYGPTPRAFKKKKVCNQKEISGGSMSNSGTTSLHLSSSDNEGHDHCLNSELEASNSIMVQTSTWDRNRNDTESWACNGVSAFHGCKYKLNCLQEQPNLTNNQVPFNGKMMNVSLRSPGVICMDISSGQEELCIPAINMIDDVPFAPPGFTYSKSIQVAENVDIPPNAEGCNCKGNCVKPKTCSCAKLNGSKFPYVRHSGGRLIRAKNVVFECGPNCCCGPNCVNRLSQRGIKYHLEVFRTQNKGWAVRTRDFIPSGAPVCEYVGLLKRSKDLDNADDNEYIFEIDCLHTIKGVEGRERRLGAVSGPLRNHLENVDDGYFYKTPEFCIDANSVGNVARFINHSCEPNLFIQCILSAHHDPRLARIVLFASDDISQAQELTYDYGCPLDSVIGSDGKVIQMSCHCGTADCRKRVY